MAAAAAPAFQYFIMTLCAFNVDDERDIAHPSRFNRTPVAAIPGPSALQQFACETA